MQLEEGMFKYYNTILTIITEVFLVLVKLVMHCTSTAARSVMDSICFVLGKLCVHIMDTQYY